VFKADRYVKGDLIKDQEKRRPLGAAMINFNIPFTDALFLQVCGLNNMLVLTLPQLVDVLTGSGNTLRP